MLPTRCLYNALQDDDNLKLIIHERALGQVEERALGIDLVADGEGRDQEELVSACSKAHIQFTLIQRQELALRGLTRLVRDSEFIIIIAVITSKTSISETNYSRNNQSEKKSSRMVRNRDGNGNRKLNYVW